MESVSTLYMAETEKSFEKAVFNNLNGFPNTSNGIIQPTKGLTSVNSGEICSF